MERRECETRYELAAAILPSRLRRIAMELPETDKKRAEEFRLRAGHCLSVLLPEGERSLEAIVTTEELETLCDIAAEFSRYASIETLRQGFLPVRGGFRVGLCGSAVVKDGEVTNLKQISSAVIRISREQRGIAREIAPKLFRDGRFIQPFCDLKKYEVKECYYSLADSQIVMNPLKKEKPFCSCGLIQDSLFKTLLLTVLCQDHKRKQKPACVIQRE